MPMRYFDLADDVYLPKRWELGHPLGANGHPLEDPWQFRVGARAQLTDRIQLPVKTSGTPLDFSHAAFSIPVVHVRVASLLAEMAPHDVDIIPAGIQGQPDQFCILNATRLVQCIDDKASGEVRYWRPEDGRPEKTGQYRAVYQMRIDPSKVGDAKIFRTWGWTIALIVSEEIKKALERIEATGTKFKQV
ncbi:imm11 family protein [Stigmatella erecta]|uniref:Immunity MXAN-0049 protein domain-containing protein n=1 Tax=Stigmatella erecta TaxID=83460 RepID=A0A1I0HNW0_9BACT|nr:DUF1629 domain-containing protein [Stigmatella erecta]SET85702.1 hypothetical protein SAMN05443639_10532 [Stigmatella erecta]